MNQFSFFKYAATKPKNSRQSSILIDDSGRVITSPSDVAKEFNKYFTSIFTVDDGNLPDFPVRVNKELNSIRFNVLSISKVLKNLKPSVSFGLDNIPNVFLRRTERFITWPLSILFECSLSANYVLALWKMVKAVPLRKKGSTTSLANYRPISLVSCISKAIEHVIIGQVQSFLQDNNLIIHVQYGFQSGSSTVTQLIECHIEWVTSRNNGEATDVIYLDYAKAFDSVIYSKLVHKLYAYGIRDDLIKWFENFLSSRTQAVTIMACFLTSCQLLVVSFKVLCAAHNYLNFILTVCSKLSRQQLKFIYLRTILN